MPREELKRVLSKAWRRRREILEVIVWKMVVSQLTVSPFVQQAMQVVGNLWMQVN